MFDFFSLVLYVIEMLFIVIRVSRARARIYIVLICYCLCIWIVNFRYFDFFFVVCVVLFCVGWLCDVSVWFVCVMLVVCVLLLFVVMCVSDVCVVVCVWLMVMVMSVLVFVLMCLCVCINGYGGIVVWMCVVMKMCVSDEVCVRVWGWMCEVGVVGECVSGVDVDVGVWNWVARRATARDARAGGAAGGNFGNIVMGDECVWWWDVWVNVLVNVSGSEDFGSEDEGVDVS